MITSICNPVHVHVEQIPPFVLNLAKFSVPFSAPISSMSNNSVSYSYKDDIMMHAKISDLPNCIQQSLVKHQRKAVLMLQRGGNTSARHVAGLLPLRGMASNVSGDKMLHLHRVQVQVLLLLLFLHVVGFCQNISIRTRTRQAPARLSE